MRVRLGQTKYKVEDLRQEIEPDQINYVPAQLGQFDESYSGYEDLQQLSAQFQAWQDSFQLTFYDVVFQPTVDVEDDEAFIAKVEELKAALDAGTLKRELPDFNVKERLAEDRGELDDDFSDELNFTDDASDFSFEDDDDVSDFSFDDDDEEVTKAQPDSEQKAEDDDDVSDFSFDDDDEEVTKAQPDSEPSTMTTRKSPRHNLIQSKRPRTTMMFRTSASTMTTRRQARRKLTQSRRTMMPLTSATTTKLTSSRLRLRPSRSQLSR